MTARLRRLPVLAATLAVTAAFSGLLPGEGASASPAPAVGTVVKGGDISWPNCPKGMGIPERPTQGQPMPSTDAKLVIMGLTNGPAFTPNPCLASQVTWVKNRHLWAGAYSITSYPTATQLSRYGGTGTAVDRLRRVGRAQAAYNVATMRKAGLAAPMVWVDVEPVPSRPWSSNRTNNNAVIDGIVYGYKSAGLRVGLYSYASGWTSITGGRQIAGVPTWIPSGRDTYAAAAAKCSTRSFSGGPVWIGQSTTGGRDIDITCPGVTGTAGHLSPLTPYVNVRLGYRSTGTAVAALQRRLGGNPTGYFGLITKSRVIAFQQAHRLRADGVVTSTTWHALGAGTIVGATASRMPLMLQST